MADMWLITASASKVSTSVLIANENERGLVESLTSDYTHADAMARVYHVGELLAISPLRADLVGDGLIVRPPLLADDVLGRGAHCIVKETSWSSLIFLEEVKSGDVPWTNPYPAGPMKALHSAATLSQDQPNIWMMTALSPGKERRLWAVVLSARLIELCRLEFVILARLADGVRIREANTKPVESFIREITRVGEMSECRER